MKYIAFLLFGGIVVLVIFPSILAVIIAAWEVFWEWYMKRKRHTTTGEVFASFSRKNLIRLWRTLKAESGYRKTVHPYGGTKESLKELMDRHEERIIKETENKTANRAWRRMKRQGYTTSQEKNGTISRRRK